MKSKHLKLSLRSLAGVVAASLLYGCYWRVHAVPGQTDWSDYLGDAQASQFSPLSQINTRNVGSLQVAWTYQFPDNGQSVGNPLVLDGRMYEPYSGGVVALDAKSGAELWRHDLSPVLERGLNVWTSVDGVQRRLFVFARDRIHAIDPTTGYTITSFGEGGSVDLKVGLDRMPQNVGAVESQAPGRVFGNLLIVGTSGESAPGYIRAYDVFSGQLVWTFHTIPHTGEPNADLWPKDAWLKQGGVNTWTGMTLDPLRGIVFLPMASSKPNYYGVGRPIKDLYSVSLLALDARTGRLLWQFQTLHHGIWDYDLVQAKLLTLNRGGKKVEAVLAASKTGQIFTFERATGRPIFPIEERQVPQSDVPGETSSPTQPFPSAPKPFAKQTFSAEDLDPILDPAEREHLRAVLASVRNEGLFTPPSLRGTLEMPGAWGGTNMDSGVADSRTGRYFVASANIPGIARLQPRGETFSLALKDSPASGAELYAQNCAACHGAERKGQPPMIPSLQEVAKRRSSAEVRDLVRHGRSTMPAFDLPIKAMDGLLEYLGFPHETVQAGNGPNYELHSEAPASPQRGPDYDSGPNFLFSSKGVPAIKPPWTTLTAYDMNSGEILWQVPYGSLPGRQDSGQIFPRGAIVGTAGGLLFAGSQDRVLRAWDMQSGQVLWSSQLPSLPGGVPAVYMTGGREFVAVPAAQFDPKSPAVAMLGLPPDARNTLVVYALPDTAQTSSR